MLSLRRVLLVFVTALLVLDRVEAFVPATVGRTIQTGWITVARSPAASIVDSSASSTALAAAEGGTKKGGKKRKRRRKKARAVLEKDPVKTSQETIEGVGVKVSQETIEGLDENLADEELTKEEVGTISDVARFEFQPDKEITMGVEDEEKIVDDLSATNNAIALPDIKEARKKKLMEEELAQQEIEKEESRVRIKRTDKEAFRRLMEQQPFADADDSYFEEEKYGTVSALLGEGAAPFLAIPFGPLQVGHFIGALVIVLMAFVEYPGFPLTNLPTPLRDCFQGGLLTVYAVNSVLAVIVALSKAPERGQPVPLWAIKTFSVGGLAYDQLLQLPTLEEIKRAEAVKGKRAIKK